MRVLVTGGAGFIGHHLVRGLLARGDRVNVIDDFSTGWRSRLEGIGDRVSLVEGSILDPRSLHEAAAGCEVILHEAAIASVERSLAEPAMTVEVNACGTVAVMLAAARTGVRRVVLAGSSAVYGVPAGLPCREDQRLEPRSPYGASKLAAEHYAHTLGDALGIETVVLRYFNVYGPGQDPASDYAAVIPRFVTAVLDGRRPTVNGSGAITRDYVHVDDVVAANVLAACPSSPSRLTCNVATGQPTCLLDLLRAVGDAAGRRVEPIFGPPRRGDIEVSFADISVARRCLGYEVRVPFRDGIAGTVAWYRQERAGAAPDTA